MIELGTKVKDKVSGFTGIAVSKIEFLNGCIQYEVMPKTKAKDKLPKGEFIDESQLIELKTKRITAKKKDTGGGFRNYP